MKQPDSEPGTVWEQDFPIKRDDETFVNRRQFTNFLVLTSLGMFCGNLWILLKTLFTKPSNYPQKVVATLNELPIGGVKIFRYPEEKDPCILVRTSQDNYVAYSQKCTHLACPVQYSQKSNRLECPCHDGHFSVETGAVLQGPPPRPLPKVVIEKRDNEIVAVSMQTGEHE